MAGLLMCLRVRVAAMDDDKITAVEVVGTAVVAETHLFGPDREPVEVGTVIHVKAGEYR